MKQKGIPIAFSQITPIEGSAAPSSNLFRTTSYGVIVAVYAAVIAQSLFLLTNLISWVTYLGEFIMTPANVENSGLGIWIITIPLLGAIAGALLTIVGKKIVQPLVIVITVGMGIPLGVEGALISGSYLMAGLDTNRWKTTDDEKQLLESAGIVSGLAFLFNSPVAAILLVLEMALVPFTIKHLIPLILAAAIGTLFHYLYLGGGPVFEMAGITGADYATLPVYALVGLLTGLLAFLRGKSIKGITFLFNKVPMPRVWLPVAGALIIGITGYWMPEGLGSGFNHIDDLLMGRVTLQLLLGLSLVRWFMVAIAAGSGSQGGMISPLLLIGGAIGVILSFLCINIFHITGIQPGVAALVGMTAMLGGGLRVWLAALVMALELTHAWVLWPPVLLAGSIGFILARWLGRNDKD